MRAPSPAICISTLALVVAATGTAGATGLIDGHDIRPGSINSSKLAKGAVQRTAFATISGGHLNHQRARNGVLSAAPISPTLTCVYFSARIDVATATVSAGVATVTNDPVCADPNSNSVLVVTPSNAQSFAVVAFAGAS